MQELEVPENHKMTDEHKETTESDSAEAESEGESKEEETE